MGSAAASMSLVQFSQSCSTLCDPMDCSTPGFPAYHQLPELTQTPVHQVGDAIRPSHSLSSLSPPTFDLTQHQGLFKWGNSLHQGPKCWSFSFSISPSNEYSGSLSILWHFLSLGLAWKLTFPSPVATAEFSKCAGILSAALSQYHLSGFEIFQDLYSVLYIKS